MNWREIPFFRLGLPYIAGIWLADAFGALLHQGLLFVFPILAALLWFFGARRQNYQWRWVYGFVLNTFLFLLGYQITTLHHELNRPHHFKPAIGSDNYAAGTIQRLRQGENSLRLVIKVAFLGSKPDDLDAHSGFLLAYLELDARSRELALGDQILLKGKIRGIDPPRNPKAFDFSRYMHLNNVHFSIRSDSASWEKLNIKPADGLFARSDQLRKRCIDILKKHLPSDNEFAVGAALLLGYKDEISQELNNAYANTGAMHVLAVSGLHVGIVYLCLGSLIGLIKIRRRYWKVLKMLLLLTGVWGFVLLTGSAPSALRAATMFSFVIVGQSLDRQANVYNSFAASAFLMLCVNPYLLFDIGFQLSYLAVIGIVYFQPIIYRLWYIENKVGDYFWKLTAVSLAAQITTLPISLFYFHQFPLYFWLSGLVVVPLSGFILMGGMATLLLDGIPLAGWLLGKVVYSLVWINNAAIFLIQQLPGGVIAGVWVSVSACILLYVTIAALTGAFEFRRFRWILVALACLSGVAGLHAFHQWHQAAREQVVVYYIPGHTAIDYIAGNNIASFTDATLAPSRLGFAAGNYRMFAGVRKLSEINMDTTDAQVNERYFFHKGLIQFPGFRMAVVRQPIALKGDAEKIPVDCLLFANNARVDLSEVLLIFDCKLILFDASSSYRRIERWKKHCIQLEMPYYDIREQGAYIRDL